MAKIIIKLTGNRPQIKFRGAITNEDIKESRRLLDCYLPRRKDREFNPITKYGSIDIPLGDYNGKE